MELRSKAAQEILNGKTWFGFDLDDTLHKFRKASTLATNATLQIIAQEYDISMKVLNMKYRQILTQKTSNAFVDGNLSHEHRRDRSSTLLKSCSHTPTEQFLEKLLAKYEATPTASLEPKHGALDILTTLKYMRKKIVVITEGPQDAQERTIEAIGFGE